MERNFQETSMKFALSCVKCNQKKKSRPVDVHPQLSTRKTFKSDHIDYAGAENG